MHIATMGGVTLFTPWLASSNTASMYGSTSVDHLGFDLSWNLLGRQAIPPPRGVAIKITLTTRSLSLRRESANADQAAGQVKYAGVDVSAARQTQH